MIDSEGIRYCSPFGMDTAGTIRLWFFSVCNREVQIAFSIAYVISGWSIIPACNDVIVYDDYSPTFSF
jgi:hypothetical protein